MAGAVINVGVQIRENSIINTRASVDHDCIIGEHVHIAPGVTLSGGVNVGDGSHIGTGATIVQEIFIGKQAFIEAGGIVVKSIEPKERLRSYRGGSVLMSSGGGRRKAQNVRSSVFLMVNTFKNAFRECVTPFFMRRAA